MQVVGAHTIKSDPFSLFSSKLPLTQRRRRQAVLKLGGLGVRISSCRFPLRFQFNGLFGAKVPY